jgi:hypothetical protein
MTCCIFTLHMTWEVESIWVHSYSMWHPNSEHTHMLVLIIGLHTRAHTHTHIYIYVYSRCGIFHCNNFCFCKALFNIVWQSGKWPLAPFLLEILCENYISWCCTIKYTGTAIILWIILSFKCTEYGKPVCVCLLMCLSFSSSLFLRFFV